MFTLAIKEEIVNEAEIIFLRVDGETTKDIKINKQRAMEFIQEANYIEFENGILILS